jgi:TfoX/Sxy family transcriptional regulator of competence genes
VFAADGRLLRIPNGWELLPPGDAALTRRVKAAGPHWAVVVQRGRRSFSQGVWAPAATIARQRAERQSERQSAAYQDRQVAQRRRRDREQGLYVAEFREVLLQVLRFAPCHQQTAERLADAVAAQATPVGSGTVARTQRLSLSHKAELALLAWLRHQTSDYDRRHVARVKGERRAVRRQIAAQSRQLLERYRRGEAVVPATCPLQQALAAGGGTPPTPREPTAVDPPAPGAWQGAFDGFFTE